jgi:hypothetical protein
MTTQTWPTASNFPAGPAVGSWTSSRERNVISFKPDVGPPIERRRSNVSTISATFSLVLNETQRTLLDTFYFNLCCEGIYPFTFTNPDTGDSEVWRWAEPPTYARINESVYRVQCSIRRDY